MLKRTKRTNFCVRKVPPSSRNQLRQLPYPAGLEARLLACAAELLERPAQGPHAETERLAFGLYLGGHARPVGERLGQELDDLAPLLRRRLRLALELFEDVAGALVDVLAPQDALGG